MQVTHYLHLHERKEGAPMSGDIETETNPKREEQTEDVWIELVLLNILQFSLLIPLGILLLFIYTR